MGVCQKIVAGKVLAEQNFICVEESVPLGALPEGSSLVSIVFTQIEADCATVFDPATNQVNIAITYTLGVDITVSPPQVIHVSGIVLADCPGTFCGVAANMFTAADRAVIGCELVRVASVTHADDSLDPDDNTLTTTITIVSKFALVQKEMIIVALCPGNYSAAAGIPATPCRDEPDKIPEDE
jgi:hypothetical protein